MDNLITEENYDDVREAIASEQERLIKEGGLDWKLAGKLACEKIASQLGLEVDSMMSQLNAVHHQRVLDEPPILWESIKSPQNQTSLSHREWWHKDPLLFETILRILFTHDPIHICDHELGASEYACEVNTILPRVLNATSQVEVRQIVFEEFRKWFGPSVERDSSPYDPIATDIWEFLKDQGKR
jgi:hypothetical protein